MQRSKIALAGVELVMARQAFAAGRCGKLARGDSIRWEFAASVPVDFNIHYHVGKEVEFQARQAQVSSGQDTLRVAVRGESCWMWSNKASSRARIDVRRQRPN